MSELAVTAMVRTRLAATELSVGNDDRPGRSPTGSTATFTTACTRCRRAGDQHN
jgi:hypothetical protein